MLTYLSSCIQCVFCGHSGFAMDEENLENLRYATAAGVFYIKQCDYSQNFPVVSLWFPRVETQPAYTDPSVMSDHHTLPWPLSHDRPPHSPDLSVVLDHHTLPWPQSWSTTTLSPALSDMIDQHTLPDFSDWKAPVIFKASRAFTWNNNKNYKRDLGNTRFSVPSASLHLPSVNIKGNEEKKFSYVK